MGNEKDVKPPTPSTVPPKLETPLKSAGSLVRLPSFRQPRDLTLGSGSGGRAGALGLGMNKARKTYAPNLNVQRNKLKEEVKVKEEQRSRGRNERGRGNRGRGERGRGRGSSNIIQLTSGVFSEGMGASQRSTRQKHYDSDTQFVPKPKLDLKKNYSVDFKEENERLRQLLQDDFVDDPDVRNDGVRPLQLPMIPTVKKKGTHKNIKREPGDDGPMDFKPMSEDEGHVIFERHVKDLLSSREPEYILVQLPDCLPGLRPCEEPEGAKNATETLPEAVDGTSKVSQCTLSTMPEGCIGKIQLMKSGRAFLKLNTLSLPITMGTQVGFKQDLISVNLNEREKTGKMINLGQVKARLVMTPDWESLLGKA